MVHTTRWLVGFSLILALLFLLGCTREVEGIKEVVVTPTPGPAAAAQTDASAIDTSPTGASQAAPAPTIPSQVTTPQTETTRPPAATEAGSGSAENVYQLGISEDLTTSNTWAYLGPDTTIWNRYVLAGAKPGLYTYSDQRFDWIPSLATDFPSALREETVEGQTYIPPWL